jgi:hypothetical protein
MSTRFFGSFFFTVPDMVKLKSSMAQKGANHYQFIRRQGYRARMALSFTGLPEFGFLLADSPTLG